jgi:hypothetical protein
MGRGCGALLVMIACQNLHPEVSYFDPSLTLLPKDMQMTVEKNIKLARLVCVGAIVHL